MHVSWTAIAVIVAITGDVTAIAHLNVEIDNNTEYVFRFEFMGIENHMYHVRPMSAAMARCRGREQKLAQNTRHCLINSITNGLCVCMYSECLVLAGRSGQQPVAVPPYYRSFALTHTNIFYAGIIIPSIVIIPFQVIQCCFQFTQLPPDSTCEYCMPCLSLCMFVCVCIDVYMSNRITLLKVCVCVCVAHEERANLCILYIP